MGTTSPFFCTSEIDIYNGFVILHIVDLVVLKQAEKELREAPSDIKEDIYSLFDDLMSGKKLSMPISRPLPSIAKGLHELRLSGRSGEYRVFYMIRVGDAVYVLHSMAKKKQELDGKTVKVIKSRLRSIEL